MDLRRIADIRQGNGFSVYRAENPSTKTRHLVKEVSVTDEDGYFSRRLRAEFSQMARFEHPNLLRPVDLLNNDRLLLYEDSQCNLAQYLARKGKLPSVLAANLLQQCSEAIRQLHTRQIGHGNLGATSVLVGPQGEIRLGDFLGFAWGGIEPVPDPDPVPRYQAPEFNDSAFGEVSASSDLYGLGYLILEALTANAFPSLFGPGEQGDNLGWHLDPARKLEDWRSSLFQVSEGLLDIIGGLIHKSPVQRAYRSAQELLDQVARLRITSNQLLPPLQDEKDSAGSSPLPSVPRLLILKATDRPKGPPSLLVPGKPVIIGNIAGCDLMVSGRGVASRHAMLHTETDGVWRLYDLRGTASCLVNGLREAVQPIDEGALLQLGSTTFKAELGDRLDGSRRLCGVNVARQLNKGRSGRIYLGNWEKKNRPAVLRIFPSTFGDDEEWVRRLLSDSTILSRCKAPSLVSLYEAGKRTLPEKTLWYLVLDQAPMGSLKDLIIRGETLTPWQLVSHASRACRALREAHGAGVIHGNLHPGNLLFDAAMQIRVAFVPLPLDGFIFKSEGGRHTLLPPGLRYRPPELIKTSSVGNSGTDLYALAACLLEAVTGKPPFAEGIRLDSVLAEKNRELRRIHPLDTDYPSATQEFFTKALHPDPVVRFQEPARFLSQIRKAIWPKWRRNQKKKKGPL